MGRKKKSTNVEWYGMPTDEAALKEIFAGITATHESFKTIDNEREQLKDIFEELHAKYGMPKSVFNSLAKFSYYNNADEHFSREDEIQDAWDILSRVLK